MIEKLRRFFDLRTGTELASAYLFGSHASGRAHADSDVDVAVLLNRAAFATPAARFDHRLLLAAQIDEFLRMDLAADIVVRGDAPPLIGRAIVNDGVRLVLRDAAADHAFRRDIQLRAADLEPFLRRMQEIKLRALAR